MENKSHVPNHQPDKIYRLITITNGDIQWIHGVSGKIQWFTDTLHEDTKWQALIAAPKVTTVPAVHIAHGQRDVHWWWINMAINTWNNSLMWVEICLTFQNEPPKPKWRPIIVHKFLFITCYINPSNCRDIGHKPSQPSTNIHRCRAPLRGSNIYIYNYIYSMGINRNCLYPPPLLLLKLLLLLPPQNGETVQPLLSCIYDCLFPSGIYIYMFIYRYEFATLFVGR